MAKPKKTTEGTWRVQFMVNGVRDGGTFATAREANEYQTRRTLEIKALSSGRGGTLYTLDQALTKYAEEVSPKKRGEAKEIIRLAAFRRQGLPINRKLSDISTADLAAWRDARLRVNARGSVLRDMTLLGNVFEIARREWQWIAVNPMKDVRRPQNPDHRKVVIKGWQIRRMLRAMGHGGPVRSVAQAVAVCFLVALTNGMRAGELCGLLWTDVHHDFLSLRETKNGTPREVPMSPYVRRLIARMRGYDPVYVFGIDSQSLDANFRKYRKRAGLSGFTFHDSRHTAATRLGLAKKIDPLQLCSMFGWKNLKQAMIYFNPTASQIAANL